MGETILVSDESGTEYLVDENELTNPLAILKDLISNEDATTIHQNVDGYHVEPSGSFCAWQADEIQAINESNFEIVDVYDADYGVGMVLEYQP